MWVLRPDAVAGDLAWKTRSQPPPSRAPDGPSTAPFPSPVAPSLDAFGRLAAGGGPEGKVCASTDAASAGEGGDQCFEGGAEVGVPGLAGDIERQELAVDIGKLLHPKPGRLAGDLVGDEPG